MMRFFKILNLIFITLALTSCLMTRSEMGAQDQNAAYSKKNADNQMEAQEESVAVGVQSAAPIIEDKDELIRSLNGRVEVLENQLAKLEQDRQAAAAESAQKMTLMQETLAKIENQMQRFEGEIPMNKTTDATVKNIEDSEAVAQHAKEKKLSAYQVAEQYYSKQDWKRAILNYQKYTDETPKGKNVAEAKFKIGVCFQELGMKEEAMAFYEEVVANYAKTAFGKKSKERLEKLKK